MPVSAAEAPRAGPPRLGSTSTSSSGTMPNMTSHTRSQASGMSLFILTRCKPSSQWNTMASARCQTPKPVRASRRISVVVPGRAPAALAATSITVGDSQHIHEEVEKAVGHDLEAQVGTRRVGETREKMVPLQDLMQDDAVEETAQREAEQQPAGSRCRIECRGSRVHVRTIAARLKCQTAAQGPTCPDWGHGDHDSTLSKRQISAHQPPSPEPVSQQSSQAWMAILSAGSAPRNLTAASIECSSTVSVLRREQSRSSTVRCWLTDASSGERL